MSPVFLDVEIVLEFHADQLSRFGGSDGLRDRGLLESAVAQPSATFAGAYLHEDVHAMAAAYLFHIVMNHPFVDGNKRTGYICALAFLELNEIRVAPVPELYDIVIGVAEGRTDKTMLAAHLRRLFPASTK